ncbi:ribonuclease H-like domain-containing protein [Vulgatibacter sp.]|uniref:ribonuclease H-like domain-containing protein n=1 Tax=Vulgatibacter sp. TaxID=1971226 RepID=UPI0035614F6F
MITATFRGMPGIGPSRERELWEKGFRSWDDLPADGPILSPKLDARLRGAVNEAKELLARRDLAGLARVLPVNERWRLWPRFTSETCFLDIETDGDSETVTAIALYCEKGPQAFVRGVNLEAFPRAFAGYGIVVTFNGASFDLPVLGRAFPQLVRPPIHVDLRFVYQRLGERGGLKALEKRMGLTRPGEVEGVDGWEAVRLWRRWTATRDANALCRLVEYNLYDAIQLRPLLELAYNRMVDESGLELPRCEVWQRGEVLYDVSRILLDLRGRYR